MLSRGKLLVQLAQQSLKPIDQDSVVNEGQGIGHSSSRSVS